MERVRKMKPVLKNSDNSNTSREFPARMRVLLIDGNEESPHQLEMKLKECDYEVKICNRGKEALKLLKKDRRKFDIILTERCMPKINEFELLGTLSKIDDLPPVIVMSESGNNNTIKDCIKYGAYDYLVKPIEMKELQKLWIPAFRQRISMCNEVLQTDGNKKKRKVWSTDEKKKFSDAYEKARDSDVPGLPTPTRLMEILKGEGVEGLTQKRVASKLQKHRRKIGEVGTSSKQLNLSTQHQQALAAGSTSLGPRMMTPNFQNVQVNVDHSITDKMTQTLSSHEQPCNEMSNIIQDQAATAVNVAGIEQTCFRLSESSDCDLFEGYFRMSNNKDLSVGQPVLHHTPKISQDQAAADNRFMPCINTSLLRSCQDSDTNMHSNPFCEEGIQSFTFEHGTGEANNIQEQAVGNGLTHFSAPEWMTWNSYE